jgi:cell division protein FtsL
MVEMLSYIFGSLKESENSIKTIKTTLRNQARINRTVAAFALVVAAYAIALEVHTYEQNKKIQNLDNEIKELKRMKGE